MAIDIFNPPQGGPWGVGIPYLIRDLNRPNPEIGPGHWEIGVMDLTLTDTFIVRHVHRWTGNIPSIAGGVIGDPAIEHTYLPANRTLTLEGSPVELTARLILDPSGTLVEERRQPMVWDSSYAWMLPASTTAGGFTQVDRDNLAVVKSAVWVDQGSSPSSAVPLIGQVIDLVRGPPRSLLRPTASRLLEGRGVVPASPDDNGFAAWGATWSFFTVPAGFGFVDGQVKHYINRMAQFAVIREGSDDGLYVDELIDVDFEGGFLLWKHPPPTEVRYDIAPGVQLLWRWLG